MTPSNQMACVKHFDKPSRPASVILSHAKDPVAYSAGGCFAGSFTWFRMTNRGVHWQRSEESLCSMMRSFSQAWILRCAQNDRMREFNFLSSLASGFHG